RRKSSTTSTDDTPAFLSPPAQYRQSPAWPDQALRQKHRSPGSDCPRSNSHLTAREITCYDCGHRQRQSASSNPPGKSQENHIIERRFHTAWTLGGRGFRVEQYRLSSYVGFSRCGRHSFSGVSMASGAAQLCPRNHERCFALLRCF